MSDLDLERYRRRTERFVGELDKEYYLHYAGRKPEPLRRRVRSLPRLFTAEAVKGSTAATPPPRRQREEASGLAARLRRRGVHGAQTKELSDEIANTEARAAIDVDGESISSLR